jgi:hypothetical protein
LVKLCVDLAEEQKQTLTRAGARKDFTELCDAGCFPIVLAGIVLILRYSPLLEKFWTEMVGRPDNREKMARTLKGATQTLENLFSGVIASEKQGKSSQLAKIGRLPISTVVAELHLYIGFINFASALSVDTETRSPADLAKYLLSSYVLGMTGHWHDRGVSSIVGEVSGSDYEEVRYRMWRNRNYRRMTKHFAWMTRFLVAMSVVIAETP